MNKRFIFFIAAAAIAAFAAGGYFGRSPPPPPPPTLSEISFPDVNKKIRHGEEWIGKVVVVNHWATWCPPCVEEIPLLIETQKKYATRVQIVGIAHDMLDPTRKFGDHFGINYPSLVAITGGYEIMQQHGNASMSLPFTVFFDRNGNFAHRHLGQISRDELTRAVADLL